MGGRNNNWRFWVAVSILFLAAVVVGYRLVVLHLHLVSVEMLNPRYNFTREISGLRGSIYARGGKQSFAKSVPVWEYHVDAQSVDLKRHKREEVVKNVSEILGLDINLVHDAFWNTKNRYVYLTRSFDNDVHRSITDRSKVSGVTVDVMQERRYPQGNVLSHVLGFVSKDPTNMVGGAGIEMRYDRFLRGTSGRIRGMRDARGREIRARREVDLDPVDGASVYLTIDLNVQMETEKALYDGYTNSQAQAGWAIVLEAKTGAILAMATYPDFMPADFNRYPDITRKNRCISENYEPGSVMKTITACAALNEGRYAPDTLVSTDRNDSDFYRLPGDGSHKWEPFMTVRDALVHSSNIVYGKMSYRMGPSVMWKYLKAFGFGKKTEIDLPGEETGILPHWKKWDKASWSRAGIGQYVAVTPIQMAMAYGAVANGGMLMRPYVVDRVVAANGDLMFRNEPECVGNPIRPDTARKVRNMLLGVAKPGGTARRAAVKGYTVAGKTGTAQMKEGKGYSNTRYNASFIGMIPAGDPEIVVLITYQEPEHCSSYKYHEQTGLELYNHQGGVCAGHVFSRLASVLMRYLGVEPDNPAELDE